MSRINAILAGFTAQQRAAAVQDGRVIVLAGAGAGKTKTLTGAVASRIEGRGLAPNPILAVTFTNKAAGEMTSRIRAALGSGGASAWTGTFHGLGARQLRRRLRWPGYARVSISSTQTSPAAFSSG